MSKSTNELQEPDSGKEQRDAQQPDYMAKKTRRRAPSFHTEWKVVAVVGLFVLVLEIAARQVAPRLDTASEHIFEFPDLVKEVKTNGESDQTVLVFGNSLMRHGVLKEELDSKLKDRLKSTKVTPVGTTIVDWTFLYKRYFENAEVHPDLVVVGFVRHHIADKAQAYPNRNRRLGRHFLAWEDQPLAWKTEFPEPHNAVQTSLAHHSALMGDQPEHSIKILQYMIPHYSSGLSKNNSWVNAWKEERRQKLAEKYPQKAPPVTYTRLQRFIDMMKSHGVQVWFVPMPQPEFYELDPKIAETVENNGMRWLDARNLCLGEENFSDGYHLGDKGAKIFTQWLSNELNGF